MNSVSDFMFPRPAQHPKSQGILQPALGIRVRKINSTALQRRCRTTAGAVLANFVVIV